MKKTIFCLVAAMAVLACSKKEENEVIDSQKPVYTLYGNIAQETGTKVRIEQNGNIFHHLWQENDNISVIPAVNGEKTEYKVSEGIGTSTGIFFGNKEVGISFYAIYPHNNANAVTSANTFTVTYPNEQVLTDGSYDPKANVYVATGSGNTLTFYNTTAYLRLAIYTTSEGVSVSKIELTSLGENQPIAGTGTVTLNTVGNVTSSSVTVSGNATIILTPESSVSLDQTTDLKEKKLKYFYIAVPAVNYNSFGGYQIKIYSVSGNSETYQFRNISGQLSPNTVRLMSPLEYNPVSSSLTATLKTGQELNQALKTLAGTTLNDTYKTSDSKIKHIIIETNKNMTGYTGVEVDNQTVVSANNSDVPIIASWNSDTQTIRIQTAASKIHTQNCASMFRIMRVLETITGLDNLVIGSGETSGISMGYMFMNDTNLQEVDMSGLTFNYSGTVSLVQSFAGCSKLSSFIPPTSIKTASCLDVFHNCSYLTTLDLGSFDTSSSANMSSMFIGCSSLESVNLSSFDTANVTNMSEMFSGCFALKTINLGNFNTAEVTNASKMFYGCSGLTGITFGDYCTFAACTDMSGMFLGCSAVEDITFPEEFTCSSVTNYSSMFEGCTSIKNIDLSHIISPTAKNRNISKMFYGCTALESVTFTNSSSNNDVTFRRVTNASSMFEGCLNLKTLVNFENAINLLSGTTVDFSNMFLDCSSLTEVSLRNISYNTVTNASRMFENCSSLSNFSFGGNAEFSTCSDMSKMFYGCSNLETLTLGSKFIGAGGVNGVDLTNFVPSGFTNITCSDDFRAKLVSAGILSNSN